MGVTTKRRVVAAIIVISLLVLLDTIRNAPYVDADIESDGQWPPKTDHPDSSTTEEMYR